MKSYIVRDVAKEIGVSVNTFRYHLSDLQEGVYYTRGDNNNRATITEDALIRIANNGKFKFSSILLRFLELNKECGLDVPKEDSNELKNCKKALEYLQEKYLELQEELALGKLQDSQHWFFCWEEKCNENDTLRDKLNEAKKEASALTNTVLNSLLNEVDTKTKVLLIWNIVITVLIAFSFSK